MLDVTDSYNTAPQPTCGRHPRRSRYMYGWPEGATYKFGVSYYWGVVVSVAWSIISPGSVLYTAVS